MPVYNADLHLHSPYSIAVSQQLSVQNLVKTAKQKGLHLLTSGDITQAHWRASLKSLLKKRNGCYWYKDVAFLLGTELEDNESIHHVVLLPDFHAAEELEQHLEPFVKNIGGRWAGRPHVHKTPAEIVDLVDDVGGICGPAHAFTPFKSIFRSGKFNSLKEAYQDNLQKVAFLELGLSADTFLADRIKELSSLTFLSNSDAHSHESWSLGREFNQFEIDRPSFDEIKDACLRKSNKRIIRNVGFDPRLGKYFKMFCRKCRKRILLDINQKVNPTKPIISDEFIQYSFSTKSDQDEFLQNVGKNQIECVSCKVILQNLYQEKKRMHGNLSVQKIRKPTVPKLKFGVSERINELATWDKPHHPSHRPPYLHLVSLYDILRFILQIKSYSSKTVLSAYQKLIKKFHTEYKILLDLSLNDLMPFYDGQLANIIGKMRNGDISILPGGGGTLGKLI